MLASMDLFLWYHTTLRAATASGVSPCKVTASSLARLKLLSSPSPTADDESFAPPRFLMLPSTLLLSDLNDGIVLLVAYDTGISLLVVGKEEDS